MISLSKTLPQVWCGSDDIPESCLNIIRRFRLQQLKFVLCAASQEESLREISVLVCSQAERSHDQKRAATETREQKVVLPTPIVMRADFQKDFLMNIVSLLVERLRCPRFQFWVGACRSLEASSSPGVGSHHRWQEPGSLRTASGQSRVPSIV
jgi:hypothetical protein